MRIYFAGGENEDFLSIIVNNKGKNILISYYYLAEMGVKNIERWLGKYKNKGLNLFLDCGAYTAWAQKIQIDLSSYMNFIKQNMQFLVNYVALDVKDNPEKTKENLTIMEKEGLKPIAVYHITMNDWNYFEQLCQTHSYVAIGAIAGERLDSSVIEGNLKKAVMIAIKYKTRLHIFGMTAFQYMKKYPLYSVDSTSWLEGGKIGSVMIYERNGLRTFHYGRDKELYRFKDYITQAGVNYNEIRKPGGWKARDTVNIYTFLKIEKDITEKHKGKEYWKDVDLKENNLEEDDLKKDENAQKDVLKSPKSFEDNKGKIAEIIKNPEIEKRRLQGLRKSMTDFKTGRYAVNLPYYCNECYVKDKCPAYQAPKNPQDKILCGISKEFRKWFSDEDFNYREENKVNMVKNRIIDILMQRAGFNLWAELLDGGIQDKALTTLLMGILDRLINRTPLIQQNMMSVTVTPSKLNEKDLNELRQLIPKEAKEKLIEILKRKKEEKEIGNDK